MYLDSLIKQRIGKGQFCEFVSTNKEMKLLSIILPILVIVSISGQEISHELPDSSDLSLHDYAPARALDDNSRRGLRGGRRLYQEINVGNNDPSQALGKEGVVPGDDEDGTDIGSSRRGLRGGRRLYWENVGNGGHARTGDAYGPFGTTGHARGGDGGDSNIAIGYGPGGKAKTSKAKSSKAKSSKAKSSKAKSSKSKSSKSKCSKSSKSSGSLYPPSHTTTGHARGGDGGDGNSVIQQGYRGHCGRRCRRYGQGRTNVGNGAYARTGNAYGPYGTTGNARGGDGGDGNVVMTQGSSRPYWDPPYYGPYYGYGGVTNVGNGGNARTGDAYGPFGTSGHARGGDGGDGNVVVNQWDHPWWD